jgi:hypothetical protein
MAGFNRKFKVSNNYIGACRRGLVRVYYYNDGPYAFINGKKTSVKDDIDNGNLIYAEYHHSRNKQGYNSIDFYK